MYTIDDLCNKLNAAGIFHLVSGGKRSAGPWKPTDKEMVALSALPQKNLASLVEMEYEQGNSYGLVYSNWQARGFLDFMPFMLIDASAGYNPTMVISMNRYLQLHSGICMQISTDFGGSNFVEMNPFCMNFLLQHEYNGKNVWKDSLLASMLCYALVMDAAFSYENFRHVFYHNTGVVDVFIKTCMNNWGLEIGHTWGDFSNCITLEDDWLDDNRKIYSVSTGSFRMCEFAIGEKTIQVRSRFVGLPETFVTIWVPDIEAGLSNSALYDDVDYYDYCKNIKTMYQDDGSTINNIHVYILFLMAMAMAGVRMT